MPAAKFSAEQYDAIYQEIKNGDISIGEKAKQLNMSRPALYRILNRRYGYHAGHSIDPVWSRTLNLPQDPAILGYIAGIIDGEGSIMQRSDKYWVIKVSMTDEKVIKWLYSFGGKFAYQEPNPPRKPIYSWIIARRRDIVYLLKAILPYMIVKQSKAQEAIVALRDRLNYN